MSATDDRFKKTVTAHGSCAPSPDSALPWIESLGVRMWEWCEYDGYCRLRVTRKRTTERSLRGGQRIAGILREIGVTEEQAKNWHWRPEEEAPNK